MHVRSCRVIKQTTSRAVDAKVFVKMGCGMSTEEKEGRQRNEEIDNQLKRDKLSQRNEIKMLLLGERVVLSRTGGESGLISSRCWRVGEINHPETDEIDPRRQLFSR